MRANVVTTLRESMNSGYDPKRVAYTCEGNKPVTRKSPVRAIVQCKVCTWNNVSENELLKMQPNVRGCP